jgi:hypothetical protein
VGSASPSASDAALAARLEALGYVVIVRTGSAVSATDADGKSVVVISESTLSTDVGTKLRHVSVPVLSLEPALFDDLKMTGPLWLVHYGDKGGQKKLEILSPGHAMAAGQMGPVQVTTAGAKFVWGRPAPAAQRVAALHGFRDASAIFGYPAGAPMVGLKAPARRVGWFAGRDTPASLNPQGWALFDAAVKWATAE